MEKRNWLWKKRPSEKSLGETESSGSFSSHSERHSDEQDAIRETPDHDNLSPEVTSKAAAIDHESNESPKILIEKLSAALVNVSAKEDLVKQHAKVAEEAVAGWEKAENEVALLKQQLEAAVQQNLTLEVRVSHLNGALKECVRQLRQARDEQEERIQDAVLEKKKEWESAKAALENQLLELQMQAEASKIGSPVSTDPNVLVRLECLEKENTALKLDLCSRSEELQIRTIERDLSTQAAESASKQQLESIKKVTKLEAECRRLQALARRLSLSGDQRSFAVSSFYAESSTSSQSGGGDRLKSVDIDSHIMSKLETSECEQSCSDSWASALIAELDQFKTEKPIPKTLAARYLEIDMMDDFLEMERLAAVAETANKDSSLASAAAAAHDPPSEENPPAAERETISQRVAELEQKLEMIEAEKTELENALSESQDALKVSDLQLKEAQIKLEELQKELDIVNESKELLEFQLFGMEVEARTMSANIDSLKTEIERERSLSSDMETKCQELENELRRKSQEVELHQASSSNGEMKKQEDLAVAADKLAECQKTIASLGKQLQSLATLEDFLIDTANLPGASGEEWKLHVNETFTPKRNSDTTKIENCSHSVNGNEGESLSSSSSSSTSSATQVTTSKSRNGFGKLFSRNKSGVQL